MGSEELDWWAAAKVAVMVMEARVEKATQGGRPTKAGLEVGTVSAECPPHM